MRGVKCIKFPGCFDDKGGLNIKGQTTGCRSELSALLFFCILPAYKAPRIKMLDIFVEPLQF